MNSEPDNNLDSTGVSAELKALRAKVSGIFHELAGERAAALAQSIPASSGIILKTMLEDHSNQVAYDITHDLTDWAEDAAFLVALHLYPEKFSEAEIREGVDMLLVHVPNHLAAAAKLAGEPIEDIFNVNALSGRIPYEPDIDFNNGTK